jgi:hypothetical protein
MLTVDELSDPQSLSQQAVAAGAEMALDATLQLVSAGTALTYSLLPGAATFIGLPRDRIRSSAGR